MFRKKDYDSDEIHFSELDQTQPEQIPRFFLDRILGWRVLAAVAIIGLGGLAAMMKDPLPLLGGAAAAIFCWAYSIQLRQIAKRKEYFVLRLTCVDVRPLGLVEGTIAYFSPSSHAAFRGGKMVAFETKSGQRIFFTYEKTRKFIPGAQYDFYFHKPPEGQPLTTQLLEQLRIDHSIVSEEISKEDI